MKNFFLFLSGLVFVELRGSSPERFFNLCKSKHIKVYDISSVVTKSGTKICAKIRLKDYKRIRPITRKSHCIPYIRKRIGFPFLVRKYRGRVVFFAGGIYFIWFLWLLSCFLFDIRVTGGFIHTEQELLSYLYEKDVVCGMRRSDIDCAELERQIRIDFPDIGWVSADLVGSRLNISLSETNVIQKKQSKNEPVHLVASSDGIVEKLVIRSGVKMVSVGDVVKKGDVMVSGVVPVVGDNELLLEKHAVAADADILLKTVKNYRCEIPAMYEEKQWDGNDKNGYTLFLGNSKIFSYLPSHPDSNYDIITKEFVPSKLSRFKILFRLTRTTVRAYTPVRKILTETEQKEELQKAYDRYKAYLSAHGTTVLTAELNNSYSRSKAVSEGKLLLLSAAYETVPVMAEEWRIDKINEHD